MLTEREEKLVRWLRQRKVATQRHLQHQFQVSHMTVFRALKKYGYYTSYNYNAGYYTLRDVPQFDEEGLWSHRDIRFSRHGHLPDTLVALVEQAAAGRTVSELETRLQTPVANLLSRLVHDGRLQSVTLRGRQVVYVARPSEAADRQRQLRQAQLPPAAAGGLPPGCSAREVIAVLRQMILTPDDGPEQWARQLQAASPPLTAGQVVQVLDHYGLEKKRLP
jgi:hypothetical protein